MLGVCDDRHTKASTERHTDTSEHAHAILFYFLSGSFQTRKLSEAKLGFNTVHRHEGLL